jgi:hypothetical protein
MDAALPAVPVLAEDAVPLAEVGEELEHAASAAARARPAAAPAAVLAIRERGGDCIVAPF